MGERRRTLSSCALGALLSDMAPFLSVCWWAYSLICAGWCVCGGGGDWLVLVHGLAALHGTRA